MQRTYIKDLKRQVGQEVSISGWVDVVRDQGKMIFFDFRDATGVVQGVVLTNHLGEINQSLLRQGYGGPREIRNEWVLTVKGKVNQRPEKMVNKEVLNGDIELEILDIAVLNKAETLPFDISSDTRGVSENLRLKYRYLDLR
ncbi:MAG: OB-fold nucleic acid binding domain-containing protein, partial [Patescibacteria group bacterium]